VRSLRCDIALRYLKSVAFAGKTTVLVFDSEETGPLIGKKMTEKTLAYGEAPDAVFCFSDDMAWGCIQALTESGLSVGGNVAVVGFDDEQVSAYMTPPLSTVNIPAEDLGRDSARLMVDLLENRRKDTVKLTLQTRLVERSTGRIV
ncbi:MAG: substrate-binding domain-containing protein, partial [Lentisphaerota bacterium]